MIRLSLIMCLCSVGMLFGQTSSPSKATSSPPEATASLPEATASPSKVFSEVSIDQHLNEQVPLDLQFLDEEGRTVTLDQFFHSKPVVLSLVYYKCPMLCTQVLNGMVESFNLIDFRIGNEFNVVTVSIDPAETPDLAANKKQQYVAEYKKEGARNGWHFLTGTQASITRLANAVGFKYVYDEQTKQFAHASGIMIATPEGKLSRYLYGIEYVAKDLTFSLMDASKGKIGSPVQKLQLLCYAYDPSSGKYSLVVTNIVRGAGILTVVLLAGYAFLNIRRERKRKFNVASPPMHTQN
ncbi:MAG TPA: SCO family protein [Bacteroidota bacterium]|nr:SCO family protein [Bacteroidota bacterium]